MKHLGLLLTGLGTLSGLWLILHCIQGHGSLVDLAFGAGFAAYNGKGFCDVLSDWRASRPCSQRRPSPWKG